MTEILWMSDSGRIVCERAECMGLELFAQVAAPEGLNKVIEWAGERFTILGASDLAEFGALLATNGVTLPCDGGHVEYNVRSRVLRSVTEPVR